MKKKVDLWSVVEELQEDVSNDISGGTCGCGCFWAENGGSSAGDNGGANALEGIVSPPGPRGETEPIEGYPEPGEPGSFEYAHGNHLRDR